MKTKHSSFISFVSLTTLLLTTSLITTALASPPVITPSKCGLALQEIEDPYFLSLKSNSAEKNTVEAHRLMAVNARLQLEQILTSAKTNAQVVDNMADQDLRRHVFVIEALLRLFKGSTKGKADTRVKKALKLAADLEDQLGDYTDTIDHIKHIQKIREDNTNKDIPDGVLAAVQARFEKAQLKQKKKFIRFLKDQEWLESQNSVTTVREALDTVTSMPASESRAIILDRMVAYLEKIDERISDVLDKNTVDFHKLEQRGQTTKWLKKFNEKVDEQVHPPRRWLRWFSLMVQSSNMFLIKNGKDPVPQFKSIENDPDEMKKYGQLQIQGTLKNPIYLNAHINMAFVGLIGHLGKAKEFGQFEQAVIAALQKEGLDDEAAVKQAGQIMSLYPGYFEPFMAAYHDLQMIKESNLLGLTIKTIKDQR